MEFRGDIVLTLLNRRYQNKVLGIRGVSMQAGYDLTLQAEPLGAFVGGFVSASRAKLATISGS